MFSRGLPINVTAKIFGTTAARARMRKQRSEGRLLFIVLVIVLSVAVIWIATHLHF